MSLSQLERSLSGGTARIYLLTGDAMPIVEEAVARVLAAAKQQIRMPAFNVSTYRAGDASAAEAFSAARTLPMMDARRLVVLKDVQDGSPELWARFLAYAGASSDTTVLLATGTGLPKAESKQKGWGDRVAAAAGEHAVVLTFAAKDVLPIEFAQTRARALGKELPYDAARLLVELAGPDPSILAREVEKLALFVGDDAAIGQQAVSEGTSQLAEAVIWDLTGGVATRDAGKTLVALQRLLDDGNDPRQLLGLLVWQWRELLKFADAVRSNTEPTVKLRPELQRVVRNRVATRDFPGAAALLGRMARAWREMNGHKAGDRHILEALVLELLA